MVVGRHTAPRRRSWAATVAAALLCAACGSTVPPVLQRAASGGSGGLGALSGPAASAPAAGAAAASGAAAPGSAPGTSLGTAPGAASGSAAASSSSSQSSGTAGPAAPGPAQPAPLTIGLTYTDNSSSTAALGGSTSQTASQKSVAEALVRGFNAHGGLAGHRLQAVEYSFNADDSNYSTDAQAACTSFTQDHHVSIVLDTAFGIIGGFRDCLQRAGVVDLTTQDEGDRGSSSHAVLHANTATMNADREYASVLLGLTSTGYLSRSNQLGVIVEGCPEGDNAWTNTLRPLVSRLGLKPAKEDQIACTTGFASAGPAAPAINNAILDFRQAGVDRVMFVSYNEAVVLLLFGNDADSQRYYPGYLLSSGADAEALRSNIPQGQWPQLHGVGFAPYTDVDGATPSETDRRCDALVRAGGVIPASYLDEAFVYYECGPFLLLESALTKAAGQTGAAAVMAAVNGLGAFDAPGLVSDRASFTSTKHDGPDEVQPFAYLPGCTCMRYSGSPHPAPA